MCEREVNLNLIMTLDCINENSFSSMTVERNVSKHDGENIDKHSVWQMAFFPSWEGTFSVYSVAKHFSLMFSCLFSKIDQFHRS